MISVEALRVQNLRSIDDSTFLELKPISILVGKNSSGKSTLARVLPLLRQSAEVTKRGPLLWWGRLVDFGSFDEAISRNATDRSVKFAFKIRFDSEDLRVGSRRGLGRLSLLRVLDSGELTVTLTFKNSGSDTYTSKISLEVFDYRCDIEISEGGIVSSIDCGSYSWRPSRQIICYAPQDRLIPGHVFFKEKDASDGSSAWEVFDPFVSELPKAIRNFVHGNTTEQRIRQLANKIPLGKRQDVFGALLAITNPASFHDGLLHFGPESVAFKRLCDVAFVASVDVLLEQVNATLTTFSNEIIYLEPLRATAQRYYRQQSLAVGEIDSKGENIAMYLDSLGPVNLRDFNNWTSQYFGIEVAPRKDGGHISIGVKHSEGGEETNIADMGFGFSQMLPIAAQLWAASTSFLMRQPNRPKTTNPLLVIEQPELHLHPEYQARLADVFVAAIKRNAERRPNGQTSGCLRILAETHSPALVNRLGSLIAEQVISKDDVQVVLLDQAEPGAPSRIQLASFDDSGILCNWPIGFFEPDFLG